MNIVRINSLLVTPGNERVKLMNVKKMQTCEKLPCIKSGIG